MYQADSSHWKPEDDLFPFFEDGHHIGTHTVYLHRVFSMDQAFVKMFQGVCGVTRHTPDKAWVMYQMAKTVENLPGSVAEVGAYRGGTAKLLAEFLPRRSLHVYDTFEGIPDLPSPYDEPSVVKQYPADYESAKQFIGHSDRVSVHKGIFPDTFDLYRERFVFVHLDVDTYSTMIAGLKVFYPLMIRGGVIFMDDWHSNYKGVDNAILTFFRNKPETVLQFAVQQAFILKE